MQSVIPNEPVRGVIGNVGALKYNGMDGTRGFVRGDIAPPPIHYLTGMRPTSVGPGTVTWTMPVTPWLMDRLGFIYGGIYALFADAPLGGALYTNLRPGQFVTTTEISISYIRVASMDTGNFIGRGKTVHAGRETGISTAHIEDRHGRLMAFASTRCVFGEMPFDPEADLIPTPEPIDDPPDPYLRKIPIPVPDYAAFAVEKPIDIMRRFTAGDINAGPSWDLFGCRPTGVDDGTVELMMPASPWFSAGLPTMYGGATAWALDNTLTGAIYSSLDAGAFMANLDLKVRFLRPAFLDSSQLTLTGEVVHRGRSVRTARAEMTDANGKRIALATGSAMVLPDAAEQLIAGLNPEQIVNG